MKRILTRRRRALRCFFALALLALAANLTGVWCLTVDQAQRRLEREELLGRTENISFRRSGAEAETLSKNSRVLVLAHYTFSWNSGWQAAGYYTEEREEGRPFTAGIYRMDQGDIEPEEVNREEYPEAYEAARKHGLRWEQWCVFGCFDAPEAEKLVIEFEPGETAFGTVSPQTAVVTRDACPDGFLLPLDIVKGVYSRACFITAYDGDSQVLGVYEATAGKWYEEKPR